MRGGGISRISRFLIGRFAGRARTRAARGSGSSATRLARTFRRRPLVLRARRQKRAAHVTLILWQRCGNTNRHARANHCKKKDTQTHKLSPSCAEFGCRKRSDYWLPPRSEEHTSELQSRFVISYA